MASCEHSKNTETVKPTGQISLTGRPDWPYEEWKHTSDFTESGSLKDFGKISVYKDGEEVVEPLHWFDGLDEPVKDTVPLNTLIRFLDQTMRCDPKQAREIQKEILAYMEATLDCLKDRYDIFHDSYVRLVGSMAEHSKLSAPDEFDFAILLPAFADEKICFHVLLRETKVEKDRKLLNLIKDLEINVPDDDVLNNFHELLNLLWFEAMKQCSSEAWELDLSSPCHKDGNTIAGTFHVKRKQDDFLVSLDICFWVPISPEVMNTAPDDLLQRDFLLENAVDSNGLIYAMFPRDNSLDYQLNSLRFATSFLEIEQLHRHGPESVQLLCYRLAKCIASVFIPKVQKKTGCGVCEDSLVSSFCLKQIILFMMHNHRSEMMWTSDQLANRLCEVFSILQFCVNTNAASVSSFYAPYQLHLDIYSMYDPQNKNMVHKNHGMVQNSQGEYEEEEDYLVPCSVPTGEGVLNLFEEDTLNSLLKRYFRYVADEPWKSHNIINRIGDLLGTLLEEDEAEWIAELETSECEWDAFHN